MEQDMGDKGSLVVSPLTQKRGVTSLYPGTMSYNNLHTFISIKLKTHFEL